MLATLNLQLSPLDSPDDTLTGPAAAPPEITGEANSGFAHHLRLRVDTNLPALPGGEAAVLSEGEPLPQGGNMLPPLSPLPPAILPLAVATAAELAPSVNELLAANPQELTEIPKESLPTPELAPEVMFEADVESILEKASEETASEETSTEQADISLDTAVDYPPSRDVLAEPLDLPEVPLALPVNQPVPPASQVSEARPESIEGDARRSTTAAPAPVAQLTKPELAARTQEFLTAAGERLERPPGDVGLRDRGEQATPQPRTSAANMTRQPLDVAEKVLPTELPRRPELSPLQDARAVTETVQPRSSIPQMPQAQPTPQPAQAAFIAAPVTAASSEATYVAAAQQATEFIGTPVKDAAWGEQISERVAVMASNNLKSAEIRLTPAELGPLRIRVSVEEGAANVTFHAQHAVTREAIEQAMPRLREMLAENGLSLDRAEVGEQGVAGRDKDGRPDGQVSDTVGDDSNDVEVDDASRAALTHSRPNGLVDTFA